MIKLTLSFVLSMFISILPITGINTYTSFSATSWSALKGGLTGGQRCNSIAISGVNTLYAAGLFSHADGTPTSNIAQWDGTDWSTLGDGLNGECHAIVIASNGHVFCGGGFSSSGVTSLNNIGEWDGTSWSPLGSGLNGTCFALTIIGTDLYAVGDFTVAGGNTTNRVAKWDGTNWTALAGGMAATCRTITNDGTNIYVGGDFEVGTGGFDHIAKYDGTAWSSLGSGLNSGTGSIICRDVLVNGTTLYAAGRFTMAGGVAAKNIAAYDLTGGTWSALGSGLEDFTRSLAFFNGVLYAGGDFVPGTTASRKRIAKWTIATSLWSGLDTGLNGRCRSVEVDAAGNVYAGGDFTIVDVNDCSDSANSIAKWGGDALPIKLGHFYAKKEDKTAKLHWETHTEFNNKGFDIQKSNNNKDWLSIGWGEGKGNTYTLQSYSFVDAMPYDGQNYYRLKQIDFDEKFSFSNTVNLNFGHVSTLFTLYPNPAKNELNINVASDKIVDEVKIYTSNGKLLSIIEPKDKRINISHLAKGTYVLQIKINHQEVSQVFMVE